MLYGFFVISNNLIVSIIELEVILFFFEKYGFTHFQSVLL